MNKVYRLVWSARLGSVTVAAETARGRGKAAGLSLLPAMLLWAIALSAHALPQGGVVKEGAGSLQVEGNTLTVTQTSANMAIEWQRFNTSNIESVVYLQPDARAIALNRVIGTESSTLLGSLTANGQVWLLNPNGVLIGQGATVNVGGLLTSSLFISDADFMSGKRVFGSGSGNGSGGSVINRGTITVGPNGEGGYVAMLGGTVSNEGTITARLGTVALASGSQVTLNFNDDKLLAAQVDRGVINALAQNKQLIAADGGTVILTAQGVNALLTTVVNNEGTIEAHTLGGRKGKMVLNGGSSGGTVKVAGKLEAVGASGAAGGLIALSGTYVKIADSAVITAAAEGGTAGQLQITASGFTVGASEATLASGMSVATLANQLALNTVDIKTGAFGLVDAGDIDVTAPLSWATTNPLTLEAHRNVNVTAAMTTTGATTALALTAARNININANISATGADAGLTITPGTSAGGGYRLGNGAQINLQPGAALQIAGQPYTVINTLVGLQGMGVNGNYALGANIDASSTTTSNGGAGFVPVGIASAGFSGILDGLGHQVTGLNINRSTTDYVGLIGYNKGTVRNIGLVDVNVKGKDYTGGLVGDNFGTISNVTVSGAVSGKDYTGGLVGTNARDISYASVSGSVTGNKYTGGLVGVNQSGNIGNATVNGSVEGTDFVGGLAGYNFGRALNVNAVYANVAVDGDTGNVGGLFGNISGFQNAVVVNNAYASGTVKGIPVTNTTLTGTGIGFGPERSALSAADMKKQASFTNFDFTNTWRIYEGNTTPMLKAFLKPITVTTDNASKVYDGKMYADPLSGVTYSVAGVSLEGTLGYGSSLQPALAAGTYGLGGLWSTAYDISYGSGRLTIDPKVLTASTVAALSKVYDGTTGVSLTLDNNTLSGFVLGESITAINTSLTGAYNSKNVNEATTVNVPLEMSDFSAGPSTRLANYQLLVPGTITPAPLRVIAADATKIYDGVANSDTGLMTYSGFVNGETAATAAIIGTLAYSGTALGAKNVGSYLLTPSGLSSANYAMEFVDGTLEITPKTLTLALSAPLSKVYDGTTTARLTLTDEALSEVVEGESITANGLMLTGRYNSKDVSAANTVAVDFIDSNFTAGSGTDLANYQLTAVPGVITPAGLSVAASDVAKVYDGRVYGDPYPLIYSGFVNGETAATADLTGTLAYGPAQGAKNVGSYAITPAGLSSANYTVRFVDSTLKITPKALTLALSAPLSKVYDGTTMAHVALTDYALDGLADQESITANHLTLTGRYNSKDVNAADAVVVDFTERYFTAGSGTDLANYQLNMVAGAITPAALMATANDASKNYDAQAYSGGNGLTYRGFVGGDTAAVMTGTPIYSGTAQGALRPGMYTILPEGVAAANYRVGFAGGKLTVAPLIFFNASMHGILPHALVGQRRLPKATDSRLGLADRRQPAETECKKLVKRKGGMQCVDAASPQVSRLPQGSVAALRLASNVCRACAKKPTQP